jgi:hypothetical protein
MNRNVVVIFFVGCCLALVACGGGGGGGGGDSQPADLYIDISPSSIDTGDRVSADVLVDNLKEGSIALKVRFPSGMRYVSGSAKLILDESSTAFNPTTVALGGEYRYIVFYLAPANLAPRDNGRVTFLLSGAAPVEDGEVAVDADVDDPAIPNQNEFSASDPKFDPQDAVWVRVRGQVPATPTPSVTATPTPAAGS